MSTIFPRLDPHLIISNRIEAPTVVNAIETIKQELVLKLTQTGIGNRLQAEVIAKLADGSFIAKIADLPVHVELPRNPAIGQKISLTIAQILPHPVFAFHEAEQGTSLISLKSNLGKAETPFHDYIRQLSVEKQQAAQALVPNQPHRAPEHAHTASETKVPANHTPSIRHASPQEQVHPSTAQQIATPIPEMTTETELSPAARIISQILKEQSGQAQGAQVRSPKALIDLQQLSVFPTALSTQLANAIRHQVQNSGLFYESHLANWLNGKMSLDEIKLEPQARLSASISQNTDTSQLGSRNNEQEKITQLVSQQLNFLDQQRLHFQGLLTAGVPFHWIVDGNDHSASRQTAQTSEEPERSWHSRLEIELPELGKIVITFALQQNKLDLTLKGNKNDTITTLNARFPELLSMMRATGTDITSYKSMQDELP